MASVGGTPHPGPDKIFTAIHGFQRTAVMKAAIDLEIFTHIAEGAHTAADIAKRCKAAERGIRILADYLTVEGFLTKSGEKYDLSVESRIFLNKKSEGYMGGMIHFLLNPKSLAVLDTLTDSVRKGGRQEHTSLEKEDPIWIAFARSMVPMMMPQSIGLAAAVKLPQDRPTKVLDIAASHGIYGIQVALVNPKAQLVAVDWQNVLEITKENAAKLGVQSRFSTIAGSAFEVDLGKDYDLILIPNFLHHFDIPTCEGFLAKCAASLRRGGMVAIVEFVPNEDRVSPPMPAQFSMMMLAMTPGGDAYTEKQYRSMLTKSGFGDAQFVSLTPSPETLVVAVKN